ncbi:MAG: transcription-repair coupling factor [Pseudomonadota bacterium]
MPTVYRFPDLETLPYDHFSPHAEIVAQRLRTLYRLGNETRGVLLLPVQTLCQRLPPMEYLRENALVLQSGQRIDLEELRANLVHAGYRHVDQVMEHGEFAVRGSLLDLFPMSSEHGVRVDFFDDEIDSIRFFDTESQRSSDTVQSLELLPAHEFPLNDEGIATFRANFREAFEGRAKSSVIYQSVSDGLAPSGIEYYTPLFFESMASVNDYLPTDTTWIRLDGWLPALDEYWSQIDYRYDQYGHDIERPLLPPDRLFLSTSQCASIFDSAELIDCQSFEIEGSASAHNFGTRTPGSFPANARNSQPLELLKIFLDDFPGRVLICADSPGRREVLLDLLHGNRLLPTQVDSWSAFLESEAPLAIAVAPCIEGMHVQDNRLCLITEPQLLGERPRQTRRNRSRTRDADSIIANLNDLDIGAPVVHIDHGVGRYQGLTTLDVGGNRTEFLTLSYAGNDKLYVPVASLHLISRYSGASADSAPLHKLGGDQWQKIRRRAAQKAYDVATELLEVYARREARQGHAFEVKEDNYRTFTAAFPYEETHDQRRAIDEVITDMRASAPMDRIVCGDVGFGKTEVAMRAAFAAIDDGKQVVVLVPTTLLAQQHLQNFSDRFADWPVLIESLSRFRTKKEQDEVIAGLNSGKVDLVIGTHKVIQRGINFRNLGLVIIDEEHRFGVRDKERLKALRAEVDILTLTATPIPRTLNMTLSGMRGLSIITTPPAERLAIKTFVSEWSDALIREALQRELARGGQVYFLHNEVNGIERIARTVDEIVPEARARIAHGQMPERELEATMLDFYHQRFNVLVCTTIIESGIDVPSANTIVINRADKLGLAQLHQLRGRVGRSHHRAYAYLLAPPRGLMSSDAEKRLGAIESLEELGVGFTLATHDMEIRGAGELLGEDQSGQIQEIGFTLYNELLERAVQALKDGQIPDVDAPLKASVEVDLHAPALLPQDYVPDVHSRLILYKRIASAVDTDALRDLKVELIDRFGLLPEASQTLFDVTSLKLRCLSIGVQRCDCNAGGGKLTFGENPSIELASVIQLVQSAPNVYRFEGGQALRFTKELDEVEQRIRFINELLDSLCTPVAA